LLLEEQLMQEVAEIPSRIGEDRIQEAFQYAASGMAITDLDGCFQQTNPTYRQILGCTEPELQRETILSVTYPEDRPNCQRQIERLLSGEIASFVLEKRYLHPGGSAVWVRNSFSLLKDEYGCASHIILICHDITERRRAERLLLEREKLAVVGQLASSIAHEINNPLEAVLNLLFLIRGAESLKEARSLALQAEDEAQRVAQISAHMLKFHKEQTKPATTDISELIQSVLTLFKGKLIEARVCLRFESASAPQLICYPGEIRQVLANLIRNAIDAMPNGGDLRLRARTSTLWQSGVKGVRITIADTGMGMSLETSQRICDPFFTTKGNLGTGLGLWVTTGILVKHRGRMRVRSSDRSGASWTVFTLLFPTVSHEGEVDGLGELDAPSALPKTDDSVG
jgi:PAS domain S-box-containing protein